MAWEVEYTDEFGEWWETLAEAAQIDVDAVVLLLEAQGPDYMTSIYGLSEEKGVTRSWQDLFVT